MIQPSSKARSMVAASPVYYGWVVWLVATIGMIATSPGQSFTVSLFIDHFIEEFGLSRTMVSGLFSLGTFAASLSLTFVGRWIDQYGNRKMAVLIGAAFATVLVLFSFVSGMWTLLLAFFGIRMLGQGALGLVNSTVIVEWFKRLRGRVMSMAFVSFAIFQALYVPWLQGLLAMTDWRTVMVYLAGGVFLATVPLAWLFMRDMPEQHGLLPDGDLNPLASDLMPESFDDSWTLAQVLRTPTFWAFIFGRIVSPAWGTGLILHQISIFNELGHSPQVAAQTYAVGTLTTAAASLLFGYLVDRLRPQMIMILQLILLILAMGLAMIMQTTLLVGLYALSFGMMMAGGAIFDGAVWVNLFGREHQGTIRGFVSMMLVIGTAIGPIVYGLSFDLFGSYNPVLWLGIGLSIIGVALMFWAPQPTRRKAKA